MAAYSGCGERDGGEKTRQEALADRTGTSLRGRSVVRGVTQAPTLPSGGEWHGSQPGHGATELGFPRPMLGKMPVEAACRAGEQSGQTEEPPPEGLGGQHPFSQIDARCSAGEARSSNWRLTRSSWRTWPHRKLCRKVPRVDGALTVQPMAPVVPPVRNTSASSMQSPPASAEATWVSILFPVFARPGELPRLR